jgi:hypothetical protein
MASALRRPRLDLHRHGDAGQEGARDRAVVAAPERARVRSTVDPAARARPNCCATATVVGVSRRLVRDALAAHHAPALHVNGGIQVHTGGKASRRARRRSDLGASGATPWVWLWTASELGKQMEAHGVVGGTEPLRNGRTRAHVLAPRIGRPAVHEKLIVEMRPGG